MKRKLNELGDEELVRRLVEAGRAEVPRPEAVAGTLRALGIQAPTVTGPSAWAVLWKLFARLAIGGGLAVAAWALWPADTMRTASPPAPPQVPLQAAASSGVLEPAADLPQPLPSITAAAPIASGRAAPAASSPASAPPVASSSGRDKGDRLLAEVRALDAVRSAIAQGEALRALVLLDSFEREFPGAVLGSEARVLRIDALSKSGNHDAARRLGEQYLQETPNGPLSNRVRQLIGVRR